MEQENEVYKITSTILSKLSSSYISENLSGKANLAKLRKSVGKSITESNEVWQILFENLPEEFLGNTKTPSNYEKAILCSLQLYALHQQGKTDSVLSQTQENKYKNIGYSLKQMRTSDNQDALDRRFNAMLVANTYEELSNHLRYMMKLLKSKAPETKVDYAKLAQDLYWFLVGYKKETRLNWAREYYKMNKTEKGEQENE